MPSCAFVLKPGNTYAYLNDGNSDLDSSHVAEAYVRFVLSEYFALTLDAQTLRDNYDNADDPHGLVGAVRLTAEF
jgi:hypothetical protein